jgi:hypothetical protein
MTSRAVVPILSATLSGEGVVLVSQVASLKSLYNPMASGRLRGGGAAPTRPACRPFVALRTSAKWRCYVCKPI